MKKLMLLLSLGVISFSAPSLGYARTTDAARAGAQKPVVVVPHVAPQASRTDAFTGDNVDWWVVEQIIQTIKDMISSH